MITSAQLEMAGTTHTTDVAPRTTKVCSPPGRKPLDGNSGTCRTPIRCRDGVCGVFRPPPAGHAKQPPWWPGLCCSASSKRQDSIIIVIRLPRLRQGPSWLHFMASGTHHGFGASRACAAQPGLKQARAPALPGAEPGWSQGGRLYCMSDSTGLAYHSRGLHAQATGSQPHTWARAMHLVSPLPASGRHTARHHAHLHMSGLPSRPALAAVHGTARTQRRSSLCRLHYLSPLLTEAHAPDLA